MPSHYPPAIANEFTHLSGGVVPQMKLQKLVYFAHGWNLAINNSPLVSETAEAWDNGPVFRSIWDSIRDYGNNRKGEILDRKGEPCAASLSSNEAEILNHIWNRFGKFTGVELSAMTHERGTPWFEAYFTHGRNSPIYNDKIENYYRELAIAGRNPD